MHAPQKQHATRNVTTTKNLNMMQNARESMKVNVNMYTEMI